MTALLIGTEPPAALGYTYVKQPPYDAVVIGSMTLGQLLRFRDERVLEALSQGKPRDFPAATKTGPSAAVCPPPSGS